jgi:hypothetical protein
MSNDAARPSARPLPASGNAPWPPGRDALQRLVERRIAEKRRAARRKRAWSAKPIERTDGQP